MIKLKSRYKSFVSSMKKALLSLKEKAVSCTKQSNATIKTYSEITNISTKETTTDLNISPNCIDLFSTINRSIQQVKNTIAKWFYSLITVNKIIKIDLLTPVFNPIPKYNIQTHSIYHRTRLFV